jgi:6-phosphofructokinase 1
MEDRRNNPSNYAMVVVSEGAMMEGGQIMETGEADAFGHRKLGGIGQTLGEELKRITDVDVVSQSLGYLMRAGAPDALDRMVGSSYGYLAVQQLEKGHAGLMMALQNGTYTTVPADSCIQGLKRVDVNELYEVDAYKPKVHHLLGKPMFLY